MLAVYYNDKIKTQNKMTDLTSQNDLQYTPVLKQQLINYISCQYEEASDFSLESLWREYLWLKEHNELHLLFVQEFIDSPLHWVERVA